MSGGSLRVTWRQRGASDAWERRRRSGRPSRSAISPCTNLKTHVPRPGFDLTTSRAPYSFNIAKLWSAYVRARVRANVQVFVCACGRAGGRVDTRVGVHACVRAGTRSRGRASARVCAQACGHAFVRACVHIDRQRQRSYNDAVKL